MNYKILWAHSAVEQFFGVSRQQPRQAQRILIVVEAFGRAGSGDVKKLEAADEWRLRSGDWRILFVRTPGVITITRVDNWRDAY